MAGAVYTIDFQTMIQIRRNDPTRRRRVRRDTPTLPAKGIPNITYVGYKLHIGELWPSHEVAGHHVISQKGQIDKTI